MLCCLLGDENESGAGQTVEAQLRDVVRNECAEGFEVHHLISLGDREEGNPARDPEDSEWVLDREKILERPFHCKICHTVEHAMSKQPFSAI